MTVEAIIKAWKKKDYQPVYWLEGEESYYVDQLVDFAENKIIPEEETAFNQVIFYGRDAGWSNVVNACMRYPMFGEKQLVLLKEAQHMKDIEKLENYIKNPLSSTILIVAYKEKKVDGRSKFGKYIKDHTVFYSGAKIRDYELPAWIQGFLEQKGLQPTQKAVMLLADHIGNDLSRLANEVEKLCINLGKRTNLTEEDVETYVGISKDYNVFELQNAVGKKQLDKAMRIVQYFEQNPKAAPIQLVLPSLYSFFSKVYMLFSMNGDDKSIAAATGIHFFVLKEYKQAANVYGYKGVESALMLLHQYNLKSIGINSASTSDASLLKELLCKMMM
ncbi:MAG: DNA polymerase III subunit delta [Bacteroidota bacterium]